MPLPPTSVPRTALDGRKRFHAAREVLERAVTERAFPGAAYGVLLDSEVVALDAVGRFTYDPDAPEVAPGTVFDLASITKVMATTAMAMLLYDRGILDLDARVGDILPGFVIGMEPGSRKDRVTLRMLLAHTSGLPGYGRLFENHDSPQALLRAVLHMPLEAQPGARTEYSDIGFILLGKALEVLSGDLAGRFFWREIATPLGFETARFCPPEDWRQQVPPTEDDRVYRRRVIQGEVQDENCYALGGVAGHAGLFSNTADVLRFAACILAEGRTPAGRQLFQPDTVRLFATRQAEPPDTSRALGWDTPSEPSSSGRYFTPNSIGHLGYSGTSLWIDPGRRLAVVLLSNRTWPNRANQTIQTVRPAFHDALAAGLS
ncbi:MAG TPA: serine hydrolase domain-containing protein [Silvibacterium sp.]|nr:serine hydrolase domain-containing protein [Silvibacterium sp.]